MARGFKVRLSDGSEVGPLDDKMLYSWFEQGLIDDKTPVLGASGSRWMPMGEAIDLSEWKRSRREAASGGGRPRGRARVEEPEEAEEDAWEDKVPASPTRWRTAVAAVLFLAGAAGAGWLWLYPEKWVSELRPVPWREIALGQVLFCLCLFPGWEMGRRAVRVAVFAAGFAVFPLAGILIAQGMRGPGLLVLAGAWLAASGLFAFLSGPALSVLKGLLALLVTLAGLAGVGYFGVIRQGDELERLRPVAAVERQFRDETVGLSLEVPPTWLVLRADTALAGAPAGAKFRFADPPSGTRAALMVESPSRAYLSLEDYLSRVAAQRRREISSWQEVGRSDGTVGSSRSRSVAATWAGEGRFEETAVVWKDGWNYFAFVTWAPAARARQGKAAAEGLLKGLTVAGQLGPRLRQAVEAVTRDVPHLTANTAEMLMGQSAAQVLDPGEAFRRAYELADRGLASLDKKEVRELGEVTQRAYAALSRTDRARLGAYIDRVRGSVGTAPEEDREMSQLMKSAVLSLPATQRARLQTLFEKAIGAALRTS
jgi:hypothetical protein